VHIVEIGKPVEIGGLNISSGDLLHGDLHGVQSIPLDIAERIPAVAADIAKNDQALIAFCRAPDFSLEKLRTMVVTTKF
jgi:regulator of RNase E activity RraA